MSYGLGVGVRLEHGRGTTPGSPGDYFWGGPTGPYFWIDPQERLIAVLMLQELKCAAPHALSLRAAEPRLPGVRLTAQTCRCTGRCRSAP